MEFLGNHLRSRKLHVRDVVLAAEDNRTPLPEAAPVMNQHVSKFIAPESGPIATANSNDTAGLVWYWVPSPYRPFGEYEEIGPFSARDDALAAEAAGRVPGYYVLKSYSAA
jgi:hypothetical protein